MGTGLSYVANTNYPTITLFSANDGTRSGGEHWVKGFMNIDLNSLPSGAVIEQVKLYLYSNGTHTNLTINGSGYQSNACWLERTAENWSMNSITWNYQPTIDTTNRVALSNSTSATQDYVVDITKLVKDMQNHPDQGNGLVLVLQNYPNGKYSTMTFYSSDYTVASKRPKIEITYANPLTVNAGTDTSICLGSSITIGGRPTVSGGSGSFSYVWSPSAGLDATNVANPVCTPSDTTTYMVTVTDANGSIATSSVKVSVKPLPKVYNITGGGSYLINNDGVLIGLDHSEKNTEYELINNNRLIKSLLQTNSEEAISFGNQKITGTYIAKATNLSTGCSNMMNGSATVSIQAYATLKDSWVQLCMGTGLSYVANTNYPNTILFSANDGTKYGGEHWVKGFMKIDLSSLSGKADINQAKLYLYSDGTHHSSITNSGYKSNACWLERTAKNWFVDSITWNNQPATDTTNRIGLSNSTSATQDYVVDITQLVKDMQNHPDQGNGLALVLQNYPNGKYSNMTFYSSDYTEASKRPKIEITYKTPLVVYAGKDTTICIGASTIIGGSPTAIGEVSSYSYVWSPSAGLNATNIANPVCSPSATTTYTVTVTDANGNIATSSVEVSVKPLPGNAGDITGSNVVCFGTKEISYSVPAVDNATSYYWSYSGWGATINGSSNSVSVDFDTYATSGNLTVYGVNACGNGTVSAKFPIIVNHLPANESDSCTWKPKNDLPSNINFSSLGNKPSNQCFSNETYGFNYNIESSFTYYNPVLDKWTQIEECPEELNYAKVCAFAIGNKVYVNVGSNTHFWEYDLSTKIWSQKTNIPENNNGGSSYVCVSVGFSIENKGYVLTYPTPNSDSNYHLWEYDPSKDNWTQKASLDAALTGYQTFGNVIGKNAYIYCTTLNILYEYNSSNDKWTLKSSCPKSFNNTFTLFFPNKDKIIGGFELNSESQGFTDSLWIYNPSTDTWSVKTKYPGTEHTACVGFSLGNKLYFGGGGNGFSRDFWEFSPDKNSILGNSSVCQGESYKYSIDSIFEATDYSWTLPENATITSGLNTRTITVSYSDTAKSGNIKVWGKNYCGISDTSVLAITVNKPIKILAQPLHQTICSGDPANLTVAATGSGLTYQWQISTDGANSWSNIKGATSASYTNISSSSMNDNFYRCAVISGSCGTIYSDTASLSIISSATIISQPASQSVCEGEKASFAFEIIGSGLMYQWQQDSVSSWKNIKGANDSVYNVIPTSSLDNHKYRCVVTSICNKIFTSAVASLTVITQPQITLQPVNRSTCPGNDIKFAINTIGEGLSYQWQSKSDTVWNDITGETDSTYQTLADTTLNDIQYRCTVKGSCGTIVVSNPAQLTIKKLIKTQPSDLTVCSGALAKFYIIPLSSDVTYQWQTYDSLSLVNIEGATDSSLTITTADSLNGRKYRCVVTSSLGTEISQVVKLTVNTLPTITMQPVSIMLCDGDATGFSITATGKDSTFQWQYSTDNNTWNNINGANNNDYSFIANSAENGHTYRCIVGGSCGSPDTSIVVTFTLSGTSKISEQPTDLSVSDGSIALFKVGATGAGLTYQWQNNASGSWTDITAAINDTCQVIASAEKAGEYRCIINGVCTSNVAELIVSMRTEIAVQPSNQEICNGNTFTFNIEATGANLAYQWQDSTSGTWSNIDGATENTYTAIAKSTNVGGYRCVVTGADDLSVVSSTAKLSLFPTLQLTSQPSDVIIGEGATVAIGTVIGIGTNIVNQWQVSTNSGNSWIDITGANESSYSTIATNSINGYWYRCMLNDGCDTKIVSNAAKLSVISLPQIVNQPTGQAVEEGETASFSTSSLGSQLSYQWQVQTGTQWENITGATDTTLKVVASSSTHATSYRCEVINPAGTVVSQSARLTMGPQITVQPKDQKVCEGSQVTFGNFKVTGTAPFTYQWLQSNDNGTSWNVIADATAATYSTTATATMNGYLYKCVVSGSSRRDYPATTNSVKLIIVNTQIMQHPVDQTTCAGNTIAFKVAVTGDQLNYQWEHSIDDGLTWQNVSGAISDSLSIAVDYSMNNSFYRCKIQGTCDASPIYSYRANLTALNNTITPLTASVTPVACETIKSPDGAVTLGAPSGGTAPYTFLWNNGVTTQNITGIDAGAYSVTLTDNLGCKAKLSLNVGYDAPIFTNLKVTDVSFPGSATGEIDPGITGGHRPLIYKWSNDSTDSIATNLIAGNYTLTVTDNHQCVKNITATVNEPSSLSYIHIDKIPVADSIKIDTALPVGSIQGTGNVSPTGAATYAIPITVLPGIKGMEPKVSVCYNSQSGNGLMGWGWNMSASSAITRVPQTIYSDGTAKGVQIDLNDTYALDGNRLTLVNGVYGADASQYHTEDETFSTITAYGNYGNNGPEKFEVLAKNGTVYKYGSKTGKLLYSYSHTIGRGVTVTKNAVLSWYLDSVIDLHGNYMAYEYEQNDGTIYLKKISYGDNIKKHTDNLNTVVFEYTKRSDPIPVHYGDVSGKIGYVLNKIIVKTNHTVYRQYNFDFTKDNFTRLYKVTESTGDGKPLNPTIIHWGKNTIGPVIESQVPFENPVNAKDFSEQYYAPADINGDGKTEIIGNYAISGDIRSRSNIYQNFHYVVSAEGASSFKCNRITSLPGDIICEDYQAYRFGEFSCNFYSNNNQDIIIPRFDSNSNGIEIYTLKNQVITKGTPSTGRGVRGTKTIKLEASNEPPIFSTGDINNDGIDEIIYVEKGYTRNYVYPGNIFFPALNKWIDFNGYKSVSRDRVQSVKPEKMYIADFDGDGMQDIMVLNKREFRIYKNKGGANDSLFSSSYTANTAFNAENYIINMGDFNGDGLLDFILHKRGGGKGSWSFALNNGKMGFDIKPLSNVAAEDDPDTGKDDDKDNVIVYDINNDGKSDVIITDAHYQWKHSWGSKWKKFDRLTTYWYKSTGEALELIKSPAISNNEYDAYQKYFITGDFNGDGRIELINYGYDCYNGRDKTRTWRMYGVPNTNNESNVVSSITNGLKQKIDFAYKPLTDTSAYTQTDSVIPNDSSIYKGIFTFHKFNKVTAPIYVVNKLKTDNGLGGHDSVSYKYEDAITGWMGKGLLGFAKLTSTDNTAQSSSITSSEYGTRYFSLARQTNETFSHGHKVSQETNTYNAISFGGKRKFSFQEQTESKDLLNNNTVKTVNRYDSIGNLTNQNSFYNTDAYSVKKVLENYNSYGSPGLSTTISTRKGEPSITQGQTAEYNSFGLPDKTSTNGITTVYTYDDFGNPINVTSQTDGLTDRTVTYEYDPTGRFVTKLYNALNHVTESNYSNSGQLTSQKNANGLFTFNEYDSWDNLIKTTSPDKKITTNKVANVLSGNSTAPEYAKYYSETVTDSMYSAEYFDLLGRSLRKITTGYKGARFFTDTKYNEKGQVSQKSGPYPEKYAEDLKTTIYTYDDYGRTLSETGPDGVTSSYGYSANKVTTSLSTGPSYSKTTDATGLVQNASDPGGTITYNYTSAGQPRSIEAPGGTVSMTYYDNGLQKTLTDPNTGTITYGYNGFGEISAQTDANKKKTTTIYDRLGRDSIKTVDGITTTYTYDKGTNALGTLSGIARSDGAAMTYTYSTDGLCRVKEKTRSKETHTFTYKYEYDDKGRVKKLIDPSGFALLYYYTDYDDLIEIRKASDNRIIWKLDTMNTKGLLTKATYGNGKQITYGYDSNDRMNSIKVPGVIDFSYQFNDKQQLDYRYEQYDVSDTLKGFKEDFTYDAVNRLDSVSVNGLKTLQMVYETDRIKSKSDAGSYAYESNHQITGLTTTEGYNPPEDTLTYTAEGKVDTIKEPANKKLVSFSYGTDDERFKSQYVKNDTIQYTRYYFDTYEKEILADGTERNLDYIYAGDNLVAIHVSQGNTDTTFFVYTDYLGSLRCITDSAGKVRQRLSFDAWGNRRNPLTGAADTTIASTLLFARGFTGHEHLDEVGLINMNGRVYDPALGMFISPDNYVQAPDNTQNFNRYTYCLNNPLMYTDPNGEWFLIDDAVAMLVGGTINWVFNGCQFNGAGLGYFATGLAAGEATLYGGPLAGGAVLGLGNSLTSQVSANGWSNINWGQVGFSTVLGVGTSYLGGQLGSAIAPMTDKLLSGVTNRILYNALDQGITNGLTGFGLGTGFSLLSGNDLGTALRDGGKSGLMGVGLGAMNGIIGAYQIQRQINRDNANAPLRPLEEKTIGELPTPKYNIPEPPAIAEAKDINVYTVTKDGVVLPKGAIIPEMFIENPNRNSNYGIIKEGKYLEQIRIDPGTIPGIKGPNESHFHLNNGKHIFDATKWPWWK
jgi:RHS repeat-associated protein